MEILRNTYFKVKSAFSEYHTHPLNIFIHLFTTPLCIASATALALQVVDQSLVHWTIGFYIFSLSLYLPSSIWVLNSLASYVILHIAEKMASEFSIMGLSMTFLVNYFGQDLAHHIVNEPTYQSSYNSINMFLEHTYFLLPLVIDVAVENKLWEQIMEYYVLRSHVFHTNVNDGNIKSDMKEINDWIEEKNLPKDVTSHWWFNTLPANIYKLFDRIVNSKDIIDVFYTRYNRNMYNVDVLSGMNEIYVSTTVNNKINSDKVFYTNHVDGPFMFLPFVSVYRGVLVMNDNKIIRTVFPEIPTDYILSAGDVALFDFNREIHRIEQVADVNQDSLRHSLKIHYVVYPRFLKYYGWLVGWLTTKYDIFARYLFISTLKPTTYVEKALSRFILFCTNFTFAVVQYGGGASVINFVMFLALVSSLIPIEFPLFMYGTSFVHYAIYICTYYHRGEGLAFEKFKHVVMAYKSLAIFHLVYNYYKHFEFHLFSLTLIIIGTTLSTTATMALGLDKTYFGFELGFVKDDGTFKVSSFPYNLGIPHPMIVGNLIWLFGVQLQPGMQKHCPNLVYIHCLLYGIHMIQEHFDVHKKIDEPLATKLD